MHRCPPGTVYNRDTLGTAPAAGGHAMECLASVFKGNGSVINSGSLQDMLLRKTASSRVWTRGQRLCFLIIGQCFLFWVFLKDKERGQEDQQQTEKRKDYPNDRRRTLALFSHFYKDRASYVTYILKHHCRKESTGSHRMRHWLARTLFPASKPSPFGFLPCSLFYLFMKHKSYVFIGTA